MERKLTAIVAADVVNYSILMGQDEVATVKAVQTLLRDILTPAASKYRGQIVRVMGDGSLLAFNSALDAVQFAIDVQRSIAEMKTVAPLTEALELRMGVNLCDIIWQGNEIHGDGVNVAVRLEELAPAGGICLSQSVYLQTKNILGGQLLPIGERHLKNITDPVQVWRWQPPGVADGVAASSTAAHVKKHFHGRQILDPKVTSILIDLHMRSACLAVSDCLDAILSEPDGGDGLSLEEIYRRVAYQLNQARALLQAISIETAEYTRESAAGQWQSPQTMCEFVGNVFDNANTFFTARLLPQFQEILQSGNAVHVKRVQIMAAMREFLNDGLSVRTKSMIKFAFVEP